VAREHTLDGAAAGYMRFLAARYGWGDTPPLRNGPLWEHQNPEPRTAEPQNHRTQNHQRENIVQPATDAGQSTIYNLQSTIAGALADLGATEDDRSLIEGVARAIADLGMAE
jgi:hypothetical protein